MKKWYVLLGIGVTVLCNLNAQILDTPSVVKINIIAEPEGGDILLRWAPDGYASWAWCNTYGYQLERYTTIENGDSLSYADQSESKIILSNTLLPLSQQAFEDIADTSDVAGVAMAAIYSDSFNVVFSLDDITTAYNNTIEERNRLGFGLFAADHSFTMGQNMGLGYRDTSVLPNHQYRYKILPNGNLSGVQVAGGLVVSSLTMKRTLVLLEDLQYDMMGASVIVNWKIPVYNNAYTSYVVERSDDNGQSFEQRNELPVVYSGNQGYSDFRASYLDSLQDASTTYVYRVKGRTPFGKFGPYSDTLHVSFIESPLSIQPTVDGITELPTADMKIDWGFPEDENGRISGFNVYRAPDVNGPFEKLNISLLTPVDRTFVDENPLPINYYQVEVVEPNGTETMSFKKLIQRHDDIAPAPPSNIQTDVSEDGIATISWAPNVEDDIMGYRVFYSNQLNGNYNQVTPKWITDTIITHRLNMDSPSEKIYVKVAALDFKENTSLHSNPVEVSKPDVHPPSEPTLVLEEQTASGVNLTLSQSTTPDVEEHQMQRRIEGTPNWETVQTIPKSAKTTSFSDAAFDSQQNFAYEYRLLAIDEVGNASSSQIVKASPIDSGVRDSVQTVVLSKSSQGLRVAWSYPDVTGVVLFQVYRDKDDTGLRAYAAVTPETAIQSASPSDDPNLPDNVNFLYIDQDIQGGATYKYQIMAMHAGGASSPLSNVATIQY